MSTVAEPTQSLIAVDVAALPTGGQLQHALYGATGMLLLSAGSTITDSIKSILTDRGIESVRIHQDDASNLLDTAEPKTSDPTVLLDNELSKQVDEVIEDEGPPGSQDSGPALRESMVAHGRTIYDPKHREKVVSQHRDACRSLDSAMETAVRGGSVHGQDVKRLTAASLESMKKDCDSSISVASDGDDKSVSQQSLQTSFLAMAIGIEMGLDGESVRTIGSAGLVADWGMMYLPEDLRGLKRQLDGREFFEIQKVPTFTANMLQRTSALPRLVMPIAYQVHEKIDGSGYPRGRRGDSIHPFAKILHVADLYTSLTSPGHGKNPAMPYAAIESILREASDQTIDAVVARALLRVLSLFPIGSYVALSNQSVGRVIRRNGENYASPVVQIVLDKRGNPIPQSNGKAIIVPEEEGLEIVRALPTPGRNELTSAELFRLK